MCVTKFAATDVDYISLEPVKARLLERMLSHNKSYYCFKPARSWCQDMPCLSCEKHKYRSYLEMSVPIALKMISYLNQALKELAAMENEPQTSR